MCVYQISRFLHNFDEFWQGLILPHPTPEKRTRVKVNTEEALLSLLALVIFPSWKHKQDYQVFQLKKENLSVPAFSGSLKVPLNWNW